MDTSTRAACDYLDVPPSPETSASPGSPGMSNKSASPSQVTKSSSSRAWQLTNWGRRAKSNNSLSASDRVLIISYFLPVTLSKDDQGQWAATWNKENLLAMRIGSNGGTDKICWVGTVRYKVPHSGRGEMAVANLLASMSVFPSSSRKLCIISSMRYSASKICGCYYIMSLMCMVL